jgi:tRNA(Ile)-lysidine synthetase-like protein
LAESDFPLTIRSPRAGDAIEMRFGRKRLNRFFIDRRIPRWQRAVWPVVANRAGQVILVPGLGCDCQHFSMMPDFNVLQYGV